MEDHGTDSERDADVLEGLRHFRDRRYFEAHEAIERAWHRATGQRRLYLQAMIQSAVAFVHLQRGRPKQALGQWRKADDKLGRLPPRLHGVEVARWRETLGRFFRDPSGPEEIWPLPAMDGWLSGLVEAWGVEGSAKDAPTTQARRPPGGGAEGS